MWKFIKSASDQSNWLKHDCLEICFIGRSNVGKSTLINVLANAKIAKTSKMPGRTQLINYFQINEQIVLVDLPGYGFANISKTQQLNISKMINQYFEQKQVQVIFVLIDARIGITSSDQEVINYLSDLNYQIVLILTKCDKVKQAELAKTLKHPFFQNHTFFKSKINNQHSIEQIKNFIFNLTYSKN